MFPLKNEETFISHEYNIVKLNYMYSLYTWCSSSSADKKYLFVQSYITSTSAPSYKHTIFCLMVFPFSLQLNIFPKKPIFMEMEKGAFHQMGSFPELPCYIIYKITALNLPSVCCEQCIFILYLKMNDFAKICTKCKIRQIVKS